MSEPRIDGPEAPGGVLRDGLHRLGLRVYFEDTDTAGIVYHARYLAFFERARTEFLRCAGIVHAEAWLDRAENERLGFAVTRCEMTIKRPARLDDWLEIHSRVVETGAATVGVAQEAYCRGRLLVAARIDVATLGGQGRPRRMPAEWRDILAGLVRT